MKTFFRLQFGHYTLAEMQEYNSQDGGDDNDTGLCACEDVSELLRNTVWTNDDNWEVVVLAGYVINDIYDGVRIHPTEILATFKPSYFSANVDEIAEKWERW